MCMALYEERRRGFEGWGWSGRSLGILLLGLSFFRESDLEFYLSGGRGWRMGRGREGRKEGRKGGGEKGGREGIPDLSLLPSMALAARLLSRVYVFVVVTSLRSLKGVFDILAFLALFPGAPVDVP